MTTFAAGQELTASALNAAVGYRKVKTIDESVGNDTLQNDDHLFIPVPANFTGMGQLRMLYSISSGTAADMKFRLTFPSSDFAWGQLRIPTGVSSGAGTTVDYGGEGLTAVTNSATIGVGAGTGILCAIAEFTLFVGGTGGTVQLQWAQNTNTGGVNTVMKKGSSLWIAEV
jgi:hypothetical protein